MKLFTILLTLFFITSCASPHKVTSKQTLDYELSCSELRSATQEAERYKDQADSEQGLTGTNTMSFLFWWPGLIATYINTTEAEKAADNRVVHLNGIYREKKCHQKS
jgi:hypothetical protein